MKTIEIEIPDGKIAEWKEIDGVMTLVLTDEKTVENENRPVTERIKTFEDAVMATGMTLPLDDNQLSYLPKDVVAYMKLRIIAAALNELHEATLNEYPNLTTDEKIWFPWFKFNLYTQKEIDEMSDEQKKILWLFDALKDCDSTYGLAFSFSINAYGNFSASLGVKSEQLAKYFGQQFIDIWADYLTAKD